MNPTRTASVPELFLRVRTALHLSQQKLGDLIGSSRRTILRAEQRGKIVLPTTWETLARATHPRDRALAAELAAAAGHTLVSLGLEGPPAPVGLPTALSSKYLVDSIVCAAAEAMQTPPHAMRPALTAAFERAIALGMTAEDVLRAMT